MYAIRSYYGSGSPEPAAGAFSSSGSSFLDRCMGIAASAFRKQDTTERTGPAFYYRTQGGKVAPAASRRNPRNCNPELPILPGGNPGRLDLEGQCPELKQVFHRIRPARMLLDPPRVRGRIDIPRTGRRGKERRCEVRFPEASSCRWRFRSPCRLV